MDNVKDHRQSVLEGESKSDDNRYISTEVLKITVKDGWKIELLAKVGQ